MGKPARARDWRVTTAACVGSAALGSVLALVILAEPLTRVMGIVSPAPDDWSGVEIRAVGWFAILSVLVSTSLRRRTVTEATGVALGVGAISAGSLVAALGTFFHALPALYGAATVVGFGWGAAVVSLARTVWSSARFGIALAAVMAAIGGVGGAAGLHGLIRFYRSPATTGAWESFVTLAGLYFVVAAGLASWMRVSSGDSSP